jgi:TfoX/Sxy family transcriptional regulator of competence genes
VGYDAVTVDRVREALAACPDVVEQRMVGGLSFLVNGNMCCGVTGSDLMVRVGQDGRAQALAEPHVRPLTLGSKQVGGFVCVEPDGISTAQALATWVQRGLDFVATLPPKPVSAGRSRRRA